MYFIKIALENIMSPAILFFMLGAISGLLKSSLEIPNSISRYLSLYLIIAIGFKGGVALIGADNLNSQAFILIFSGLLIGFLQPFLGYFLLRLTSSIDSTTAAAVAAHYGSISLVTFATACSFLKINDIIYSGYIVAIVALMEAPAIFSGLFLAYRNMPDKTTYKNQHKKLYHELFMNGPLLLLFGSFFIGCLTGDLGMEKLKPFLIDPFQGVLCLFLLDMGIFVAKKIPEVRKFQLSLVLFGVYMPLIGAFLGLFLSWLINLDLGTGMLFTILCASASYIAVPAAMRLVLPEANPAIYLPMSLVVTFPFNITVGIPFYFAIASKILS